MRLGVFIQKNIEPILVEWEAFAATLLPEAAPLVLRDHAPEILAAVVKDIAAPQSSGQQSEKSRGRAPRVEPTSATAAEAHAMLRAQAGFEVNQLVSEYRALRASVLRLWAEVREPDLTAMEDMIRFNEAIDQAVAESVASYHGHVEQARNLLLGMLGHDMRSPLSTILATASYLAGLNAGEPVSAAAGLLVRSGASIRALVDDLTDFNRTRLGLGIRIRPSDIDLAASVADELEQLRAAYPVRRIELAVTGDCRGHCDGPRLQQVLRNLVSNAMKYGAPDAPVCVALLGEQAEMCLEVTNSGPPIDLSAFREILDPLTHGAERRDRDDLNSLGLGLFIVREIARAHGGEVKVRSAKNETTFAVRLPRYQG